jgi:tRNA uridine 5-carbamoylmethylation protein Kti12
MKIIYITGEPAQGKSTFSKMLKGHHFEMDKMYCAYKKERGVMYDFDQSDWTTWHKYPDLEEYKKNYYKKIKQENHDILVIDSTTTAIKKERELIEDIFEPEETEMFIIKSKNHKKQYMEKFNHLSDSFGSLNYFKYKNKLFKDSIVPCKKTTIINYERLKLS